MPQFDQFSFLNQVFWILLVFSNFYFFISYFLLPKLAKILKFRLKKIQSDKIINNNLTLEQFQFFKQLNDSYNMVFKTLEFNFLNKKENYLASLKSSNNNILKNLPFVKTLYKFNTMVSTVINSLKNV